MTEPHKVVRTMKNINKRLKLGLRTQTECTCVGNRMKILWRCLKSKHLPSHVESGFWYFYCQNLQRQSITLNIHMWCVYCVLSLNLNEFAIYIINIYIIRWGHGLLHHVNYVYRLHFALKFPFYFLLVYHVHCACHSSFRANTSQFVSFVGKFSQNS